MNIHKLIANTKCEGPGNRCAIWVQGCSIHCDGCMAKNTWSTKPKNILTVEEIFSVINNCHEIEGVTILGGEPFDQVRELAELSQKIKQSGLSLIVFTGYLHEDLISLCDPDIAMALENIDVLVDGPYINSRRSFKRPMVGSENQRYIFLSDRYELSDFDKNTVEVRINKYGVVSYNGMYDFNTLLER